MTPFRAKGRTFWKVRVRHPDGRARVCGTDTDHKPTAKAMEVWAARLYAERDLATLDAIVSGRVTLPLAFDHRNELAVFLAAVDDVDLEPYVATWHEEKKKARKGAASAGKYLVHVRAMIPEGTPFSRSAFTAQSIRAHLRGLAVEDPTRNRHKAALSSFGAYLVDEGVLERNVVRDVVGWSEGEGRITYYERDQAKALIAALPQPFQAIEALMCGAGLEWQAIERIRARDVDLAEYEVFADGGKTPWRRRQCRVVESWCLDHIRPALGGKLPNTLVFEGVTERKALDVHKRAAEALGLPESTLHDWRHTHAVLMLRTGYQATVVAHQLGHRDTSLVWKRYGRFTVDERDYVLPGAESPAEAPGSRKGIKRGGVK